MKRFITVLMSAMIALSMMPSMAFAAESSVPVTGYITPITEGGSVVEGTDNTKVTFGVDNPIPWARKDASIGRSVDGWWIGATIYEPVDCNTKDVIYQTAVGDRWSADKSFNNNKDSSATDPRDFITVWGCITPEDLNKAKVAGKNLNYKWRFNWDADSNTGVDGFEATYTMEINPNDVKLYDSNSTNVIYPTAEEGVHSVAAIKGALYTSLMDAISDATSGDTIIMMNDWAYPSNGSGLLNITESITLDGNNHKISGYGYRGGNNTTLAINNGGTKAVEVTIKNLTIENQASTGRTIETRGNINSLKIDNCNLIADGSGNNQVLTIGGNQSEPASVDIVKSNLRAGSAGYPVITFNPVNMGVTESEFTGYSSFYFKGVSGSAGSRNSIVNVTNTNFDAPNTFDGDDNNFGAFVLEDDGITLTLDSCKINTKESSSAMQSLVLASSVAGADRREQASVTVKGKSEVNGRLLINNWDNENCHLVIQGGTFSADPSTYVADGYVATKSGNVWTVAAYVAPVPTPEPEDPITNTGSGDNASTNVDASDNTTATEAGKTETTIDSTLGDKIVENAKENNVADVVIKAETEKGDSTGSTVALPESTVQALAKDTEASVTIKTDSAEVSLDKAAVDAVAAQAGTDGEVKLVVETVENTEDTLKVELKLVTSKGTVTDFQGGNVTVTVPVSEELAGKKLVCVYIDDNDKYIMMDGALAADGKTFTFTTGHFSTYAILSEEEAKAAIDGQDISKASVSGIANKTYTGKAVTQKLTVKAGDKALVEGTDYTVSYSKNVNVGVASVKIAGKGKYEGTLTKTFKINPKGTSISKITGQKKAVKVVWKKQLTKMKSSYVSGYQVQYSTSSKFTSGTSKYTNAKFSKGRTTKTIKNLKAGKKYYVRVRTYKTVDGTKCYSSWSKSKSVKTK